MVGRWGLMRASLMSCDKGVMDDCCTAAVVCAEGVWWQPASLLTYLLTRLASRLSLCINSSACRACGRLPKCAFSCCAAGRLYRQHAFLSHMAVQDSPASVGSGLGKVAGCYLCQLWVQHPSGV